MELDVFLLGLFYHLYWKFFWSFRSFPRTKPLLENRTFDPSISAGDTVQHISCIYDDADLRDILDGHMEVTPCLWEGCNFQGPTRIHLSHLLKTHIPSPWSGIHRRIPDRFGRPREYICYWKNCMRQQVPFLQRCHFIRHIKKIHFGLQSELEPGWEMDTRYEIYDPRWNNAIGEPENNRLDV